MRETLRKKWGTLLTAYAAGQEWAPLNVPLRGPGPAEIGERLGEVQMWAGEWEQALRGPLRVEYKKVGGRHIGVNLIPGRAWVDGYEQAWALLGAVGEIRRLVELTEQTKAACPRLLPWLTAHPVKALALARDWTQLLATVAWIEQRQAPGMYLRQVDVPGVDTKFIERHKGVLTDLLDQQLDSDRIDPQTRDFEARFRFRRKPAYVRFRCSANNSGAGESGFSELTVRAEEFTAPLPGVARAYIVENEVTYLAFPLATDAMVIFGGGYAVDVLESLAWLTALDVIYWGDIDTHGFAILNRLRHHVPHARSILMDRATLLAHRQQWVREPTPTVAALDLLDAAEQALYRDLAVGEFGPAVRLEQERISFASIEQALATSSKPTALNPKCAP
ncbi:MAG TPA: Wadjet anti-phage system protein JetD domain-containing protein [Trebonia sp.]|nr:Wadjet anti-phage system protein JetD domain-containing protein [Trebonia sp.]